MIPNLTDRQDNNYYFITIASRNVTPLCNPISKPFANLADIKTILCQKCMSDIFIFTQQKLSCTNSNYIYLFLFSHLADAFVQSDLQMSAIETAVNRSNRNQQKSNNVQVLWQVLVSLTQYT